MAYENRDYTHLSEEEKQKIELIAQAIRNKAYGIDVRESIALAIEWVNREYKLTIENNILTLKEFENAKSKVSTLELDMDEFIKRYSEQIAGNTSLDETIDARVDATGVSHTTLKDRLDKEQKEVTAQLTRFDSNEVRFTAHRGLNNAYPENTLLAFEMACLAGYKVIELDIQPTSDGHLVIHHDLTVDRMTNGTGNVATKTLAEIKALVVDGGVGATEYPNLKVPTLEETLVLFRKYNVEPMIEFKLITDYTQLDILITLLKKYGFEYKSSIISSVTYLIDEFRKRGGKADALYLNTVTSESTTLLQGYGNCGYALSYTVTTEKVIQDIHDDGLSVAVYTVNDTTIARRLTLWGADYITTDTIRGVS